MSDSELSDAPNAPPNDAIIESTLRRIVRDAIKDGQEITVRIARTRAEEELGLDEGFLKGDTWKDRSKEIISAAVEEPESPVKEKPKAGRKRKSEEPAEKPKKKAKQSPVIDSDQEEEEEEKPKAKAKPKSKPKPKASARKSPVVNSDEEPDDEPTTEPTPTDQDDDEPEASKPNGQQPDDEAEESDMSSLIDEPPKKKRGPKKSTSPNTTTTGKPKSKPSTSATKDLSPDDEEIKRLQSQLLKCGIRKLWHRELAPYATPKAKISHLKSMLSDVGMTGRFSAEKARAIKEARELEAELEAARDFEEKFGTGGRGRRAKKEVNLKEEAGSGDEDGEAEKVEEGSKRPGGRLLPKGLVDFGDSGDDGSD